MIENSLKTIVLVVVVALVMGATAGEHRYLSSQAFVNNSFDADPPAAQTLWLIGTLGKQASRILGHPPVDLRERYWSKGDRSVWILDEIGKERPFTVGWVVEDHKIMDTQVLVYRETRGWEVRYPAFTQQFRGAGLDQQHSLDRNIDGISGATLSVRGMRRMAELALLLNLNRTRQNARK